MNRHFKNFINFGYRVPCSFVGECYLNRGLLGIQNFELVAVYFVDFPKTALRLSCRDLCHYCLSDLFPRTFSLNTVCFEGYASMGERHSFAKRALIKVLFQSGSPLSHRFF